MSGRKILTTLAHRWPTAVAAVLSIGSFVGGDPSPSLVDNLSQALALLPLLYLILAVLDRQRASWPVLGVLIGTFVLLRLQDTVAPVIVVLTAALAAAIWGFARGRHRERDFRVQLAGMIGFGAIAAAGLLVDSDTARYLVAAGWFAHGLWDLYYLIRNRVVARSYAEWCFVVDILIAVSLIVMPLI